MRADSIGASALLQKGTGKSFCSVFFHLFSWGNACVALRLHRARKLTDTNGLLLFWGLSKPPHCTVFIQFLVPCIWGLAQGGRPCKGDMVLAYKLCQLPEVKGFYNYLGNIPGRIVYFGGNSSPELPLHGLGLFLLGGILGWRPKRVCAGQTEPHGEVWLFAVIEVCLYCFGILCFCAMYRI